MASLNQSISNQSYKVKMTVLNTETQPQAELVLYAKHPVTFEEYCQRIFYNWEYIPKLQKWLSKKRYQAKPVPGTDYLHLTIKIFTFTLKRISRNDLDILKDEMRSLKESQRNFQRECHLFNYQFFSHALD